MPKKLPKMLPQKRAYAIGPAQPPLPMMGRGTMAEEATPMKKSRMKYKKR
mgnify:FL=1